MKRIFTFIVFITAFSFALKAQVITEEEMYDLLNSKEIQIDNPIISNFLMIRQIDNDNEVISHQNNPADLKNTVLVNQDGIGNKAYVEQNGSGLETHLWQYNSSNEANLISEGANITTSVKQEGNDNVINSYIKNHYLDARAALLLQQGNNNSINFSLHGDGMPSGVLTQEVKISQFGDGHTLDYMKENDFNSVEITQTAGVDGAGMTVNVTESVFAFPMNE